MRLVRKPQFLTIVGALLLTLTGILSFKQPVTADLVAPRAADGRMALIVANLLREDHLLKRPIDDEISRRGLKTVLKQLDPMKLYFYQADIDEFNKSQDQLDDWIQKGDLKFAYMLFNRFLERVDERVAVVDQLLSTPLDFTQNDEMVTDPDVAVYSKTPEETQERWRRRIKYDLLVLKTAEVECDEAIDRLRRRYTSYAKRMHQFSSDDLLEMYLSALTTAFDPHTNYMSPSSLENFNIQMKLNLEGIGAALMMTDGYTVVSKIIPGGAADKHGKLQPEDRVISVGQGESGEMIDVVDMNLNDVVKLIRGKAGTVGRLSVKPANSNDVETYAITRATIELKDSEARGEVIPMGKKADGSSYQVGVIDLPSFYMYMAGARRGLADFKSTTRDVRRILEG